MHKHVFFILFSLASGIGFSQEISMEEQVRNMRRSALLKELDEGEKLMLAGEHEQADVKFRHVLKSIDVVPAKLAFFVGKNSFYLNSYKQSIDWLNKYIELKGTSGMYYDECLSLLKTSEKAYIESKGDEYDPHEGTDTLYTHNNVDCGNKKVICPVCKGKAVIIQKGPLGDIYKSCPYSDTQGLLSCEDYNLLLQGKLMPRNN